MAPRPCPTCSGPVGLTLTNSSCTFRPLAQVYRAEALGVAADHIHLLSQPVALQGEVDETGAGHLHLLQLRNGLDQRNDLLGQAHRVGLGHPGQLHGEVAGIVAVPGALRALEHDLRQRHLRQQPLLLRLRHSLLEKSDYLASNHIPRSKGSLAEGSRQPSSRSFPRHCRRNKYTVCHSPVHREADPDAFLQPPAPTLGAMSHELIARSLGLRPSARPIAGGNPRRTSEGHAPSWPRRSA